MSHAALDDARPDGCPTTECVAVLVRGDGGNFWTCLDPGDPWRGAVGLPADCPESPAAAVRSCRREDGGACVLQWPFAELCDPSYAYPCADPAGSCIDEGARPECGQPWSYSICVMPGPYPDGCAIDADCVPEPCAHPVMCVSRGATDCRRPDTRADDGLCHVPVSCRCVTGRCATVALPVGCM